MPPVGPLLKNDGPACRVCGCTEHNPCQRFADSVRVMRVLSCSWVRTEGATEPLCSECSGTEADMAEAITRGCRMLQQHSTAGIAMAVTIGKAALARRRRRNRS